MNYPIKSFAQLMICLFVFSSCKKDTIDLENECISGKVLGFREYCENTFLVQLNSNYASISETVEHEGKTYHHVIKIAGGNLTLYDGFSPDQPVFLRLRVYNSETEQELIGSPQACLALYAPRYHHVPIYVSTAIGLERCP